MKNLTLFLCIFLSLAIVGCKDACEDVVCLNSGTCDNGDCNCVGLFDGTNCDDECIDKFDGTWDVTLQAEGYAPSTLTTTFTDLSDSEVRPADSSIDWLLLTMESCSVLSASVPNPASTITIQNASAELISDTEIEVEVDYTDDGTPILLDMTFTK